VAYCIQSFMIFIVLLFKMWIVFWFCFAVVRSTEAGAVEIISDYVLAHPPYAVPKL